MITEGDLEYEELIVIEGPGDSQDLDDPLQLNVAFPEGHQQYYQFFQSLTKIISANNK